MHETLKHYVNEESPFGPIDAETINVEHKTVLRRLFDPQNKIYSALLANPSLIIGRRGSGKTAYLHSIFLEREYKIVGELKTALTFSEIVAAIEKGSPAPFLSENIAQLWDQLFYFALFAEVSHRYKGEHSKLKLLNDYMAKNGFYSGRSLESFLWNVVRSFTDKAGQNLWSAIADTVKNVTGIEFEEAKSLVLETMKKRGDSAMLLMDSLEQYPTEIQSVANTMSGLLKCAGQFNKRNERFHLRLCLPAELYHVFFSQIASNPLKDFGNCLMLHWIAGELLSVAANRLSLYLELYFPEHLKNSPKLDLRTRESIQAFLHAYLPLKITNGLGGEEDGLAYILRHTQLQPRHLLMYLNSIFIKQRKLNNSTYPIISEQAIKESISESEHLLSEEVFSGYRMLYPQAKQVCEVCIPELPLHFKNSTLQRVFNRFGKKASGFADYWDFKRLLVETGIVGRVTGETERYLVGRFEYTEPHKLVLSTDDSMCLHPVFAQVFNCKMMAEKRTIYPYGCEPNAEDHRTW